MSDGLFHHKVYRDAIQREMEHGRLALGALTFASIYAYL